MQRPKYPFDPSYNGPSCRFRCSIYNDLNLNDELSNASCLDALCNELVLLTTTETFCPETSMKVRYVIHHYVF